MDKVGGDRRAKLRDLHLENERKLKEANDAGIKFTPTLPPPELIVAFKTSMTGKMSRDEILTKYASIGLIDIDDEDDC